VRVSVAEAGEVPQWSRFFASVESALEAAQVAVSTNTRPPAPASLRPLQDDFGKSLLAEPAGAGGVDTATALVESTDRIANSIDTLLDELRRQLPMQRPG
jgi:hypothetical protein